MTKLQAGMGIRSVRFAVAAFGILLLIAGQASAQGTGLGTAGELVDPKVFRVCADPRNLPFSDEAGEGFENKLAELFAGKLGEPVSYTYYPQVVGFVRNTLNALRCDVIMGVVVGDTLVQTTNPYYRTTYALVFKPGSGLDGIEFAGGSAAQAEAHRHCCRHAAGHGARRAGADGVGQVLCAHDRYARRCTDPYDGQ